MIRVVAAMVGAALVIGACASSDGSATRAASVPADGDEVRVEGGEPRRFPSAPQVPDGPLSPSLLDDLDRVLGAPLVAPDVAALGRIGESGDARLGWVISDILRFFPPPDAARAASAAFTALTGVEPEQPWWPSVTDAMIAWDLPAPPDYVAMKRRLFTAVEPGWAPFFDDPDADIDWRLMSWGGVLIDDRPLDAVARPCDRGCIPALDDPAVTPAAEGEWYPDDRLVFGVVVGGEARAYPKNIMEVHEMVNDTIGERRIAMPYCTLCGSAQVYFTDEVVAGHPGAAYELRTSGLLNRSNKVMFELATDSVFDTFTGRALSGPLHDAGVELEQGTVVTATWSEWKQAHPDTTIVAPDGGIGRSYPLDPLGGRDDNGPIFPIGDVDPRLEVQEQILGVELADGGAVAFPVAAARAVLARQGTVELMGVSVTSDGAGLVATADGEALASHQAFWFAWSQFHPKTALWLPGTDSEG